jgi:hypothetical protein
LSKLKCNSELQSNFGLSPIATTSYCGNKVQMIRPVVYIASHVVMFIKLGVICLNISCSCVAM